MPSTAAKAVRMSKKEMEKYRRLLDDKKASLSSDLAKTRSAEEETSEESTQDIADKAGKKIEDGADKVSDKARDVADKVEDRGRDLGKKVGG